MVPTLFVGVGNRGVQIAAQAHGLALAVRPEAEGTMAVLAILSEDISPPEGVENVVRCTPPEADHGWQLPDDHVASIGSVATRVLNEAALHRVEVPQGAPCDILVVADVQDPCAQALSLTAARAARRGIEEVVAGHTANVILYILVPQGLCEGGTAIAEALAAIASAAESSEPPFDEALLISGASLTARFTSEETEAQCAMALAMRAADDVGDAIRRAEMDLAPQGVARLGSFGLAAVELPVQAIAERIGLEAAPIIVEKGINTPCKRPEDVEHAAQNALQHLRLNKDGIEYFRDRMIHYDSGGSRRSVLDDLKVPHMAFERVKRTRWHILLANYAIYFRRERLDVAVERVKANADAIDREITEHIRTAVDRVVTGGRDPSNAFDLLRRLNAQATEARAELLTNRAQQEDGAGASRANLDALLKELGEAAALEPWFPSMLFRGALASLAVALFVMGFFRLGWIGNVPSKGIESLPYWLGAFLVPFVVSIAIAWRQANRARARTEDRRERCQQTMYADAVEKINAMVEHSLGRITSTALCLTAKPDELQRLNPKYAGSNEWRDVQAFIDLLSRDLPQAIRQPTDEPMEGWRLDIQRYVPKPPVFHYADTPDFNAWIGEGDTLIGEGLFNDWRSADAKSMASAIEKHAISRNQHVLQLTLDKFYRQWFPADAAGATSLTRLYNDLHSAAAPTLIANRSQQVPDTALFIAGPGSGDGEFGKALRHMTPVAVATPHHSSTRCLMIRTMHGVRPQDLDAWAIWSRATQADGASEGSDR